MSEADSPRSPGAALRAWRAAPDDPRAASTAARAFRRSQATLPLELREALVEPSRVLTLDEPVTIAVQRLSGRQQVLPETRPPRAGPVRLPPHRRWWVHIGPTNVPRLESIGALLRDSQTPGLVARHVPPAALARLGPQPQLEHLRLEQTPQLTARAWETLSDWTGLAHLELLCVPCDAPGRPLPALERLSISSEGARVDPQLLCDLASPRLQHLELSLDSPRMLAALPANPQLSRLTLDLDLDLDLELLRPLEGLEALSLLGQESLATVDLRALASAPRLRRLDLFSLNLAAGSLEALASARLASLELTWCTSAEPLSAEVLRSFRALTRLKAPAPLSITVEHAEALASLPALRWLDLAHSRGLTAEVAEALAGAPRLEALLLFGCRSLNNRGVAALARLPELRRLNLHGCRQLSNRGVRALEACGQLEDLELSHSRRITDAVCPVLASLPRLRRLGLMACERLSDAGASALARASGLRVLNLWGCREVGDVGAEALARLIDLEELTLNECAVTDLGLRALGALTRLDWLSVYDCRQVTAGGVAALRAALPDCEVLA